MENTVTQSVLERLIDREPGINSDAAISRAQTVRILKASVRRDLEWLLNSRRTPESVGREFRELERSLYNYGVPDITALNRESTRDRERLARIIEQTINTFEPRLKRIKVRQMESSAGAQHMLRFQIEGLLDMDPAPEHVSFDTVVQLSSGECQVKGDSGAG
jgi:type VI secretion system protein ImpF